MAISRSFAIVPAAGRSRRMGQDKLLLPWGESTVIESLLASWRASCVDEIVVVCRVDQTEVQALCRDVSVAVPEFAPPEMKDSVLAALHYIRESFSPTEDDVWLLAPADMPQVNVNVINALVDAHCPVSPEIPASYEIPASPEITVPICDGKRGHPVLFPWPLAQAVSDLDDDEGVNALLKRFPVQELVCDVGDIHGDLDTPADYERLRSADESHAKTQRRKEE